MQETNNQPVYTDKLLLTLEDCDTFNDALNRLEMVYCALTSGGDYENWNDSAKDGLAQVFYQAVKTFSDFRTRIVAAN